MTKDTVIISDHFHDPPVFFIITSTEKSIHMVFFDIIGSDGCWPSTKSQRKTMFGSDRTVCDMKHFYGK